MFARWGLKSHPIRVNDRPKYIVWEMSDCNCVNKASKSTSHAPPVGPVTRPEKMLDGTQRSKISWKFHGDWCNIWLRSEAIESKKIVTRYISHAWNKLYPKLCGLSWDASGENFIELDDSWAVFPNDVKPPLPRRSNDSSSAKIVLYREMMRKQQANHNQRLTWIIITVSNKEWMTGAQ